MTPTGRRPGRPRKNPEPTSTGEETPTSFTPIPLPSVPATAVPSDLSPATGEALIGRPPIRVSLLKKTGLSRPTESDDLDWPEEWDLPRKGDLIETEQGAGEVTYIRFDLPARKIVIGIR